MSAEEGVNTKDMKVEVAAREYIQQTRRARQASNSRSEDGGWGG
jgi:hypothetical protein